MGLPYGVAMELHNAARPPIVFFCECTAGDVWAPRVEGPHAMRVHWAYAYQRSSRAACCTAATGARGWRRRLGRARHWAVHSQLWCCTCLV